ncbi:Uncharacterised protein [Mycobacteroides abscessus subsp. abscessus]|nr:Uncharacterised protein [Mycobacteroides abscessus subsp. abscessus]
MQLVGPDVFGKAGVVVDPDLADGHHIAVLVEHLADLSVVLVYTLVVEAWVLVGDMQHRGFGVFDIGQTGRFGHAVRDVEAESVDAAVQPEAQGIGEVVEYLGVVPVDVGLFGGEQVQVPLARGAVRFGDPGPGRTAEDRRPVVRGQFAMCALAVPEDVALPGVAARRALERFQEPRVLGTGVVGDQVHDDLDVVAVRRGDEPVHGDRSTEKRIDLARVGHVVAVVRHRRSGHRI